MRTFLSMDPFYHRLPHGHGLALPERGFLRRTMPLKMLRIQNLNAYIATNEKMVLHSFGSLLGRCSQLHEPKSLGF
jgi:hypothetical protein